MPSTKIRSTIVIRHLHHRLVDAEDHLGHAVEIEPEKTCCSVGAESVQEGWAVSKPIPAMASASRPIERMIVKPGKNSFFVRRLAIGTYFWRGWPIHPSTARIRKTPPMMPVNFQISRCF